MTNYPWSSLIRISPFRSILWNIFFLLSHSLTYEMLPTGPWIDRQKCFSHRRANQTTDFSTCESVPTTCPRIASYWEDKMMGVILIYVWVLSGIRASAIRNDVTDWITHRDISGQCHPIPSYQFWSQTDCKKNTFLFWSLQNVFLSPSSGCHGPRFRRFICNIAITWLYLLKIVLWSDLSYNCDQNASLPSDSKSFSNNFVLSLSFSSLPDSFCCLITTCIKSSCLWILIFAQSNCLWHPFSFSQIVYEVYLADLWLQILL